MIVEVEPEDGTGVYIWINTTNGKVYIGSAATGFKKRLNDYNRDLPQGKCHNKHLQNAWDKYGIDSFKFCILERCLPNKCTERETYWISEYDATNPDKGYNMCRTGYSNLGIKRSDETKAKISASQKGKSYPAKTEMLIERNKTLMTPEVKSKKSTAMKKYWENPDNRKRMSDQQTGRKHAPELVERRNELVTKARRKSDTTKLSIEDVIQIKTRFIPKCKVNGMAALAREFKVSISNIFAIINGVTWKNVVPVSCK